MPRQPKGPRLYFRKDKRVWIIRDTSRPDRSTGTADRSVAEAALGSYIASKDTIASSRRACDVTVSEVLDIYGREHAASAADPARIGYAIDALLGFWGALTIADVKGETCRRYRKSRVRIMQDGSTRQIGDGTLRRELSTLQAAINYCFREGYLLDAAKVTMPPKPAPRDRWLTRDEAAALIWAAWRSEGSKHLAKFILVALNTGTRKEAILNLGFNPSLSSGWVDLDKRVLYRRGAGERETKKRRKPVRMTRGLLGHCRRWKRNGQHWVVEIDGQRVGSIKKSFASACQRAGLTGVTPHTLKHTAITWAIQKGMRTEDAADYFDTTVETIYKTYYHHSPTYQSQAVELLERKL